MRHYCKWFGPGNLRVHREATRRSEELLRRLEEQQAEVTSVSRFAQIKYRENHIADKIRAAIREERWNT